MEKPKKIRKKKKKTHLRGHSNSDDTSAIFVEMWMESNCNLYKETLLTLLMRSGRVKTCWKVRSFKKQRKKKKKRIVKKNLNSNIRNHNALSIYAFKGGFKRHNARFENGEHFLFLCFIINLLWEPRPLTQCKGLNMILKMETFTVFHPNH